jgi:DNA-binding IclR family transcriptional regulator
LLGHSDAPLGVHAIARALDLVPSTCLHILRVLVREQLITVDVETKKYAVGAGLVSLARTALRQNTFSAVVQTELDQLSRIHGTTALGVEASGGWTTWSLSRSHAHPHRYKFTLKSAAASRR